MNANYFEGMKEGKGEMVFSDGSRFEGEFRKDQINGIGSF